MNGSHLPSLGQAEVDTFLEFASQLADAARPIALSYFRTPLDVISKRDESPVTIADRSIEAELRRMIEARFPEHGIYGEEMGAKPGDSFTWVIDPIDGTKSFITGFPLFGTLISLAYDQRPFLGLIDVPPLRERWAGIPGKSLFQGAAAATSGRKTLSDSRFYTTSPDMFRGEEAQLYERLSGECALRRFGGDCYIYGLLASGHCDAVLETGLQPYDYMALVPVVAGAGGVISDWNGAELGLSSDGHVLAAATPELHEEALAVIRG